MSASPVHSYSGARIRMIIARKSMLIIKSLIEHGYKVSINETLILLTHYNFDFPRNADPFNH